MNIDGFFSGVWDSISHLFDEAETALLAFFKAGIDAVAANGGTILASAAEQAVAAVAADPAILGDEAKRNAAASQILNQLAAQGIQVGTSALNLAIEAAVATFKSTQNSASAAPAAAAQ